MRINEVIAIAASLVIFSGCSTTQEIVLAKANPTRAIQTVSRATGDSNATDMNKNVEDAFSAQGIGVKGALPADTRKSPDVDGVVTYSDQWRWDLVMYLQALTVNLFDAGTGDLLVTGQWHDSTLHGFKDAREVTRNLVADMLAKLKSATGTQK